MLIKFAAIAVLGALAAADRFFRDPLGGWCTPQPDHGRSHAAIGVPRFRL